MTIASRREHRVSEAKLWFCIKGLRNLTLSSSKKKGTNSSEGPWARPATVTTEFQAVRRQRSLHTSRHKQTGLVQCRDTHRVPGGTVGSPAWDTRDIDPGSQERLWEF